MPQAPKENRKEKDKTIQEESRGVQQRNLKDNRRTKIVEDDGNSVTTNLNNRTRKKKTKTK